MKMQNSVIFVKKNFKTNIWKVKTYHKVRDHCHYKREYRGDAHRICNLKYSIPKKAPIVFHNGSNYDYHFIKKEFAEEFKKKSLVSEETLKST